MLSLCRQFSSSLAFRQTPAAACLSTSAAQSQEVVEVLKLNMLKDNPGAVKKKRRIGRGIGSSKGKTAGRGHKGQKARAGGSISIGFEGGQTKFYKLLPKRGFTNKRHKTDMLAINLGTIQDYVDMGRLTPTGGGGVDGGDGDNNKIVTLKDLCDAGICTHSSIKHGVKLLAKGKERLKTPLQLEVSRASTHAIEAMEAIGGEVTTVHYNRLALRALLKPNKFIILPKFARPPPKWQPYYTNWDANRGYLSVQAQMRSLLKERPELEEAFAKALEERRSNLATSGTASSSKDD
ncbi:unnamed protein product [Cylindrotheca closterium]|uniref:Large ribosomal subunit protein uL15/eL18 domain-containing protein n=1 Tax=Cylindrotheca closterium TaxID=2856 RepID=A0AAD2G0U5_9STRA|nr:unnamed protein product [Cylindrotheca closterium]